MIILYTVCAAGAEAVLCCGMNAARAMARMVMQLDGVPSYCPG